MWPPSGLHPVLLSAVQMGKMREVMLTASQRCLLAAPLIDVLPSTLPLFGALAGPTAAKYKQIQYLNLSSLVW